MFLFVAPTALKKHGIGLGKKITSYPSVKNDLIGSYAYQENKVVVDGMLLFLSYFLYAYC